MRFKRLAHGTTTGNSGVARGPLTTAHRTSPEVARQMPRRERMDMPGKREIQELMEKRVKQDAASHNSAKKQPDNLSGRLSRVQWRHWLKRVLCPSNKVD